MTILYLYLQDFTKLNEEDKQSLLLQSKLIMKNRLLKAFKK